MKEELIKYVMERANQQYYDDFPIYKIEEWIREFFDQSNGDYACTYQSSSGEWMGIKRSKDGDAIVPLSKTL